VPELPEVETLRRQLEPALVGRAILDAWISPDAPALLRGLTLEQFLDLVRGRRIKTVERRGKWLVIGLSGDLAFIIHLRMTGRILLRRPGDAADAYMRARLTLDDGTELRWCDLRKFGTWNIATSLAEVTGAMGPEPLDAGFTPDAILSAAARRRAPIKTVLLDQRRIAGLGNIYVDEALWRSRIHPLREAGSLNAEEAERLREAIVAVLEDSLESGGSSLRDYLDTAGRRGRFQDRWQVYKREGTPCYRCGTEIVRISVGGRGTRYCPACQDSGPRTQDSASRTPRRSPTDAEAPP
jgi:formamidopyrimidine-DNA glycosylase